MVLPTVLVAMLASILTGSAGRSEDRAAPDAESGDGVMIVTTDTTAYCRTLSTAIAAYRALPREVMDLKAQGDGLCHKGQVQGGIARLRRALLVLEEKAPRARP